MKTTNLKVGLLFLVISLVAAILGNLFEGIQLCFWAASFASFIASVVGIGTYLGVTLDG